MKPSGQPDEGDHCCYLVQDEEGGDVGHGGGEQRGGVSSEELGHCAKSKSSVRPVGWMWPWHLRLSLNLCSRDAAVLSERHRTFRGGRM